MGTAATARALLIALHDDLDEGEIAGGAEDAAFVATVASEKPKAITPGIVNDVVHVADCAFGECVGDAPGCARILRAVDVDFVALGVVEIFPSKRGAARSCGDMKRTSTAGDRVRLAEF